MVAAGEGIVFVVTGVGPVVAGLVLVVRLVVPGAVVEIFVFVGDLVAVQPVDGDCPCLELVKVVPVLSRASTAAVQPTTVKPSL